MNEDINKMESDKLKKFVLLCDAIFAELAMDLGEATKRKFKFKSGFDTEHHTESGDGWKTHPNYVFSVTEHKDFMNNPLIFSIFVKNLNYEFGFKSFKLDVVPITLKDSTLVPHISELIPKYEKKLREVFDTKISIKIVK